VTPIGRPPTSVTQDEFDVLERLGGQGVQAHQRRDCEDVRLRQARRPMSTLAARNALW
jgi:hypothetical protein